MAKKSKIAKDRQRREVVARYAERRAELKEVVRTDPERRAEAQLALQRLPRDASPTRLRNRDTVDGRPRAYFRAFGLSRLRLREMAHKGELPGVTKSSW
ncbi:30S ribosomal protein S14 [Actinosynnema sp. CA-248983]